jgi:uncharacterized protein
MKDKYINALMNNRAVSLLLMIIITVALSFGIKNLSFEGDYRIWFSKDNQQLKEMDFIHNEFTKAESIVVLLKPKDGNIFSKERLTVVRNMTEDLWQTPFSMRVDSISNYQHIEVAGDELTIDALIQSEQQLTADRIRQIEGITTNDPILVNQLISPNGNMTLINISTHLPGLDLNAEPIIVANYVKSVIEKYREEHNEFDYYISGVVGMNASFSEAVAKDSGTLMPLLFVTIVVVLGIFLRSITAMLCTLVVVAMTIAATLGFAGWLGISLNAATVNTPTMVMTLAVADCIHILVTLFIIMREGTSKAQAIIKSLQSNFKPVAITSITTALGFLSMNLSEAPPMRDLGNLVSFGVIIALVYAVTVLPILLSFLPVKGKAISEKSIFLENVANFMIKQRHIVLPSSILVVLAFCMFIGEIETSDEPLKYFGKNMEFRQAAELMQNDISGITTIEYSFSNGEVDGINSPEMQKSLEAFADWLRTQPETDHVFTLSDILKQLNMSMNGGDVGKYRIPDNKNEAAQYLLLYEMSMPFGLNLKNMINTDKSATRVLLRLKNMGSKSLVSFEERSKQWIAENIQGINVKTGSTSLTFAHIGERNIYNMLISILVSLLLISVILMFAFKSIRYGLISIISNVFPVLAGFGMWGLLHGQINIALAVVASMTIGIIVDDTVHFLIKYQRAKAKLGDVDEAIRETYQSVGSALLFTTLTLCAGFGVLIFSELAMNSHIGLLTIIVMSFAILIDLILLPSFLSMFDSVEERIVNEFTEKEFV